MEYLKSDRYGNPQTEKDQDNIVEDNSEKIYQYYQNRRRRHTTRRRGAHAQGESSTSQRGSCASTSSGTHHNHQLNEKNLLPKYRGAEPLRHDQKLLYQRERRRSRRHPTQKTTESGKENKMNPQNYHKNQRARRRHNQTTKGQRASCRPTNQWRARRGTLCSLSDCGQHR